MGQTAQIWEGLLQRVVEANRDIVGAKRLKGHLDRLAEKYPALQGVAVSEGGKIELPDDFPEDDSGLMTVCTILGALFWALDQFTGASSATDRIRRPVHEYIETLPQGAVLGLNKYLPKLQLEGPVTEELAGKAAGEDDAAPGGLVMGTEDALMGPGTAERKAAAELPGEEPAAKFPGTVEWLGEPVPRGCSLLVEGDPEAKERCALRFIKEGLEAGEAALALIAYPPEELRKKLAEEGLDTKMAEEEGRLRILDWSTFRERHIEDLEYEGSVTRLPMELPYVGSGMNIALQGISDQGSPRAFVNILPRALATVAVETVFNFVQVTILKFKKKNITGLFIMDEEKDPEKAAIRLSFHSWVDVKAADGGRLKARFGGQLLAHKVKLLAPSDRGMEVVSEEASAAEEPAPELTGSLLRRMDEWRSQGYAVTRLEEALRGSPSRAKTLFDQYERAVERARILRNELKILDLSGFEGDATELRQMLKDVDRTEEAEEALAHLKARIERKKQGTVLVLGKEGGLMVLARPAEALPVQDEDLAGEPPPPAAAATPEGTGMDTGAGAGQALAGPPGGMRGPDGPPPQEGRGPGPPAGEEKRKEFREALEKWKEEGYEVLFLEKELGGDLESARRSFLLFRVQLQRLRELAGELGSFEDPALAGRRAQLAAMLHDVTNIPQLEKGLSELRAEAARLKEEQRSRKEEERQRRAQLTEKLFWWSSHGMMVDRLEASISAKDLAAAEDAMAQFEPRAQRLLKLKEEMAALDATDFREEAAALDAKTGDVDLLDEVEAELAAFKEHLALHSRDAKARRKLRERLELWGKDGFRVEQLEKLLEREREPVALEREFERFGNAVDALKALTERLGSMDIAGFEDGAGLLKRKLKDPSMLEDCRRELLKLEEDVSRARAEQKERAGCKARIEEWRRSGLQTGELETMVDKDMGTLRKAMVDFRFQIQIYDELVQLLEPLLRSAHSEQAAQLQKELRDFTRLGELEEKVLALRAKTETEAVEAGQQLHGELERDLALLEKLQRWINSGYHVRRLEGALKGDGGALRAEAERLESDIEQLSKTASALEVLDTKGLDRELAHIRAMLNDPDKLPAVRALTENLRSEIGRRKKEEERRQALRAVAKDWEKNGYDTAALHSALEGDLDKASQQFVVFHTTLAAARDLRKRLDLLELFGFEPELEALRKKLRDPRSLDEVRAQTDGLWKAADERSRERLQRRIAARQRREALKGRLAGHMENGLAVGRLEKALELEPEQAEAEFTRFEEEVRKLAELRERLEGLSFPGYESELLALRAMMNDVDRTREIEQGISALEANVEQARREEERKREEAQARLVEQDKRTVLRKRLEARLKEWGSFGLNVEALRVALEADPVMAEKKFESFENSLYRTEELRLQLHELQAKGAGDVAGAETVEKLLEDPLRLPQAERAFVEFRQRADVLLRERDSEMLGYSQKIAQLRQNGEDVSELERALERGPWDVRAAIAEHEKHKMKRDLQDTWKGIKSKLVGAGAAPAGGVPGAAGNGPAGGDAAGEPGPHAEGKIVKKKKKKNIKAGG